MNQEILTTLFDLLKIKSNIHLTEDYIQENHTEYTDLRDAIHPKASRRKLGAEFPVHPYHQTFSDRFPFHPNLSILDLLFCCGPEAKQYL